MLAEPRATSEIEEIRLYLQDNFITCNESHGLFWTGAYTDDKENYVWPRTNEELVYFDWENPTKPPPKFVGAGIVLECLTNFKWTTWLNTMRKNSYICQADMIH